MSATSAGKLDAVSPDLPAKAMSQVLARNHSLSPLAKLLYWLLVGWWATWLWVQLAWIANLTIIGAPVSLWMLNRLPMLLLLSTPDRSSDGAMRETIELARHRSQPHWLARMAYLLLVGWWLSWIWANIGWLLCATILGLPFGMLSLSYLPSVATLLKTE